jgi:plastocyanin
VTIAQGSSITWQIAGATHNVTFGTAKPVGGDIPDAGAGSSIARTFATAGTYDYQCTRHSGMTGRVVVAGDGAAPPGNPSPSEGVIVQSTSSAYSPERVEITVGGVITWDIAAGAGGVVFDDAAPSGGNIPESAAALRTSRTFSAAGDYDYHNSRSRDIKGRIRVR